MRRSFRDCSRRQFVGGLTLGAAGLWAPGVFAEELARTPAQTEGPFYPQRLPLDTDNDLLIINDAITPAVGEVTHLSGRVIDSNGRPLRNAVVEIWQVDGNGVYLHPGTADAENRDKNFQGFGRFTTSSSGEYYFRTVKPVAYPVRPAPHIHVKVKRGDRELLTTQCYVKGHPGNEKDRIYQRLQDRQARDAVTIAYTPVKDSSLPSLSAQFDIVLGRTPESR